MHFEMVDCLSLAGNPEKPNEDSFGWTANAACVFDGATGLSEPLLPGPSDAQWIARFAARRFCARSEDRRGGIRDWLTETATETERSFAGLRRRAPRENYEIPYASGIMIALDGSSLNILWFGDCSGLMPGAPGAIAVIGDAFEKRENERIRVEKMRAGKTGRPAGAILRDEFLPQLRASRNLVNTGSEWLFAPDADCAGHAKPAHVTAKEGDALLLASDGFLALATDYAYCTAQELFSAAVRDGLGKLGEVLRSIEKGDAGGMKFPRLKTSDDATALLLRLAA